jgi:hypothetical protein
MADDVEDAWVALRRCLESHSLELHDELRTYPTPIARCDEQLTRLIEQRDTAFRRLRLAADLDASRTSVASEEWVTRLRRFAANLETDDDGVLAARARLVAAMAR